MTDIRRFAASCPRCGDLDVTAEQMWLVLTDGAARDHYVFHCPGCGHHVRRGAHAITVRLLERMVPVERLEIPAEALEPHDGPPLTEDDLIDLMLALETASRRLVETDADLVPTGAPASASYLRQSEPRRS
jgi:predicted RNA-binding Zn-ribbon protein involved in translation (DUF1610 family)